MLKKHIGFKLIEAEPMNLGDYNKFKGWTIPENECPLKEGYLVKYSDDYISWSPKEVFEKSYMLVADNNTITQENVDNFVVDYEVFTKKEKITIVIATLANGFTIVESSACVDPANYCEKIGADICKERIKDKVWNHLGFLLQTAKDGIKK
jgi:hypothetical protein